MSMSVSSVSNNMSFDPTAMFKKLDTNSDGGVTKDEFLSNIKKKDGDTDEKLTEMFEDTDTDGDGKITQAENEAAMKKMQQSGGPKGPPPTGGAGASSKSSSSSSTSSSSSSSTNYDVRDTDKDGEVSIQEKLAYILKQLEENPAKETTQSEYDRTGQTTESSNLVASTFSVKA
jgi:Ca2+-binding EF-hand superfamily protein